MEQPTKTAVITEIRAFFEKRKLDPMNVLQGQAGLVSDNAVTLEEVDEKDLNYVTRVIRSGELAEFLDTQKAPVQKELKL